jgi:pyrroline-5-carboxylate reductase
MSKIAFIGGGNMASSIIGGMLANGFQPEQICVGNRGTEKCQRLQQTYGIATT